jgi:hypothetical protein
LQVKNDRFKEGNKMARRSKPILHDFNGKKIKMSSWDNILIVNNVPWINWGIKQVNSVIILTNGRSYCVQESKEQIEQLSGIQY